MIKANTKSLPYRRTKASLLNELDMIGAQNISLMRTIATQANEIDMLRKLLLYNPSREVLMCAMETNKLLRKLIEEGRITK